MDMIAKSYRGLHLLWDLNWDRVLYLATITVALFAGAWLGSLMLYSRSEALYTLIFNVAPPSWGASRFDIIC